MLADFALFQPLEVSAEQWNASWAGDPMFLALHDGEVVGCAGLHLDTDRPERAENALTAVAAAGGAAGSRRTSSDARCTGPRPTTSGRSTPGPRPATRPMIRLNRHLGYVDGAVSITVSRPLPLTT